MKNKIINLSSNVALMSLAVVTGAAITFALTTSSLRNETTTEAKAVSDKDRASLAYPILKRRGPLTKEELDRGATPAIIKHRAPPPLQPITKHAKMHTDS